MTDPRLTQPLDWLRAKRRHVLSTLDGLDGADVRRPVLPSGWSLLGLVHHLALDVERVWLRRALGGDDLPLADGGAWAVPERTSPEEVVALYETEAAAGDAVLADLDADAPLRWWFTGVANAPFTTALEVVHHVLVETATHAGHADAARELVDGRQRLVLD